MSIAEPQTPPAVDFAARSFYVTGGTLRPDADSYVERDTDRTLLESIYGGEYCYVLNARQMGKSSLCVRTVARLKQGGVHTAFIDLTRFGVSNLTHEQWYAAILRQAGREFGIWPDFSSYWKENLSMPAIERFFGALQDVALAKLPGNVVVFVDEIDVTRSLPFETDEFFARIRQCFVGRATEPDLSRLTFCLFGTATPTELIADTRVSPFNVGRRIELRDFLLPEARALEKPLGANAHVLLDRVFYWTNGHPYLTQRLCREVSLQAKPTPSEIDKVANELFLGHKARESDDNLAFVRNRVLNNEADLTALLELYRAILDGKRVPDDDTNPLCGILKMAGICRVDSGLLKVRNRIYGTVFDRRWVEEHLPDAEIRRQRRAYRKGVIRTAAFAMLLLAALASLAAYGFNQAGRARKLAASLQESSRRLEQALAQERDALGRAQRGEQLAREATGKALTEQRKAETSADEAQKASMSAQSASHREQKERVRAEQASKVADQRLSQSLVHNAMDDLNNGDGAAALSTLVQVLKLDANDPHRTRMHRIRIQAALNLANTLELNLVGQGPMRLAEFLDPSRVVTVDGSGSVSIWDVRTGASLAPPIRLARSVAVSTISEDRRRVYVGCHDGTLIAIDVPGWKRLWSIREPLPLKAIGVSGDGNVVATAMRADGPAKMAIRDARTGRALDPGRTLDNGPEWAGLTLNRDGSKVLARFHNNTAYLIEWRRHAMLTFSRTYNLYDGRFLNDDRWIFVAGEFVTDLGNAGQLRRTGDLAVINHFGGDDRSAHVMGTAICFSRDEREVALGRWDGCTAVYDVRSGSRLGSVVDAGGSVNALDLSPDGSRLATGDVDGRIRVWNVLTGKPVGSSYRHAGKVVTVRFTQDGRELLTAGVDGAARLWHVGASANPPIAVTPQHSYTYGKRNVSAGILSVEWPSGSVAWVDRLQRFVQFASFDHFPPSQRILRRVGDALRLYDLVTSRWLGSPIAYPRQADEMNLMRAIDPEGRYAALEVQAGVTKIYRCADGAYLATVTLTDRLRQLNVYPDGTTVCLDNRACAKVLNALSNRLIVNLRNAAWVSASPDGTVMAVSDVRGEAVYATVYRLTDGLRLCSFPAYPSRSKIPLTHFLWSPDSRQVFMTSAYWQGILIDCAAARVLRRFRGEGVGIDISAISYLPLSGSTGNTLLVGGKDAGIYDFKTGALRRAFPPRTMSQFAVSADEKVAIASTTSDVVRTFDAKTGLPLAKVPLPIDRYTLVDLSPNGELAVSCSVPETTVWDARTGEPVLPPIGKLLGGFTADSRRLIVHDASSVEVLSVAPCPLSVPELERLSRQLSDGVLNEPVRRLARRAWSNGPDRTAVVTKTESLPTASDALLGADDGPAWLDVSRAALRADQWGAARQASMNAIRKGFDDARCWQAKGTAEMRLGLYAEALVSFQNGLKRHTGDRELMQSSFFAAVLAGNTQAALVAADLWSGQYRAGSDSDYHWIRARRLMALAVSDPVRASRDFASIYQSIITDSGAFSFSIPYLVSIALIDGLVPIDRRCLDLAGPLCDSYGGRYQLLHASLLARAGRYAEAESALGQAGNDFDPRMVFAGLEEYTRARICLGRKDASGARRWIDQAEREVEVALNDPDRGRDNNPINWLHAKLIERLLSNLGRQVGP